MKGIPEDQPVRLSGPPPSKPRPPSLPPSGPALKPPPPPPPHPWLRGDGGEDDHGVLEARVAVLEAAVAELGPGKQEFMRIMNTLTDRLETLEKHRGQG
jgi:hypothetical protein